MTKKHAKESKAKKPPIGLKIVYAILIAAQTFMSVLLISAIGRLNILQPWQFAIVIAVLVLLLLFNAFKLLISQRAHRVTRVICALLSILVIIASAFGFKYIHKAVSFMEDITGAHKETIGYQVRVLQKSEYNEIKDLAGKKIGILTSYPGFEDAKNALTNAVEYEAVDYDEIGSMLAAIYDKKIQAVVINQSYLDFLEEAKNTFEEDSRMIYEFEIEMDAAEVEDTTVDVTAEPFIAYISGSDSRGSISQVARSDVNIVAVVNPNTSKILLISIPRDYYVQLHGTTGTKDKLTHAGIYGIEKSKTTIEDLLGIIINYTMKVGFNTLLKVVDAVDGIEINSDIAFSRGGCNFVKGKQTVNSTCALVFSRERYSYASGDRHRGQNQQQVLTKLIQKLTSPHYLVRYDKILEAAKGTFETSLTYDEITSFVRHQLNSMKTWEIESIQLDGTGSSQPTYSMGSQKLYVMIPDQKTITNAKQKIAEYLGTSSDSE